VLAVTIAVMCNLEHEGEVLEDPTFLERMDDWGERIMENPMTRRSLLGLMGVTGAQSLLALSRWPRTVDEVLVSQANMRLGSHEYLDPSTTTSTSISTTTTTTAPPPQPTPPQESRLESAGIEPDEWTPEQKMDRIYNLIGFMPGLQQLYAQKPNVPHFQNIPEKMAHIERLRRETDVSVDEYHHTVVNESMVGAFRGHFDDYTKRITPRLTVVHWTGEFYQGDMNRLVRGMIGRKVNYNGVVDQITNGQTQMYRFFDEDFPRMGAHAHRGNQLGRGYAMVGAKFEDLHPLQLKEIIKAIVRDHRMDRLAIDHTTVLSHFAIHLILDNPTFNPSTQLADSYGKFDIPQEAIDIIIEKAQALDVALGPRP
jgi:hypothetical protein